MKDVRVASVQFTHRAGDKHYNLSVIEKFARKAAASRVEIIAFPEMCITGYWHVSVLNKNEIEALAEPVPSGRSSQYLLKLSNDLKISIGAGLIEIDEHGNLFNTYVFAMPDGRIKAHRKLHTFVSRHMSSGDTYTVFDTPHGCRVGVLTCWDNNLVENARITALKGAEILIAPHQTGGCHSRSPNAMGLIDSELWINRHTNPEALRKEMQGPKGKEWVLRWLPARAHDNGMFVIFSNGVGLDWNEVRTGHAMILSPYGERVAETDSIEDDMVIADLKGAELEMCTGRRWIRGRRPELYGDLCIATGRELDPYQARFSDEKIS
ncbi:nitrilase family protein [Vibrio salinus]|uniref:nitrilase family protein n=1 Tax=Vibrio salinus TaxID=2899784 RepID=UPI001E5DA757|nr:nitrilase family protein [Vibrio salinus]MCE0495551.1 nitrilase family protein [Vibrio salinus]